MVKKRIDTHLLYTCKYFSNNLLLDFKIQIIIEILTKQINWSHGTIIGSDYIIHSIIGSDYIIQYSWQHILINAEHLKGLAFNAEVLLGIVNHGLMISFITLICTGGQHLNKQYAHNDFQVDVPDSIGVSKIYLSMYVWYVTLVTFYLVEIFT
jgi:hypothetical protein